MLGSRPLSRTTAFAPRRDLKPEKPFHQERPALFVASPNHNPKLPILSISYLSRFPVPQTAETLLAIYSKDRATGEPDDAKVSSPVRRGADGKGRSRLPVTADAYGLTNPGIRRNLASRLPYE